MKKRPNIIQTALAVAGGKATRAVLRATHRGGTSLPGKVARSFSKDILKVVSEGMDIIVVTGTNGKTTTAHMLEHAMTGRGRDTLANKSGANLLSGVVAEFVDNADWRGRPEKKYAVIECDEGAMKQVVPLLRPKVIVVTNLFRDQLDRYGEVMHALEEIKRGIVQVPDTILCLNADDSLTASLALGVPNPVVYYGLDMPWGDQSEVDLSDARRCIRCGTEYEYHYHTYAHLGGFYCPSCGYQREKTSVAVTGIDRIHMGGSDVRMTFREGGREDVETVSIGLPAVYNVYNAAAALAAYRAAGYDRNEMIEALATVTSSFGRMETFELNGCRMQMILVKNPAGCNQAISYVNGIGEDFRLVVCLNNQDADGTDISWIWDADYEKLCQNPHAREFLVAGERAEDMTVRLKYAGASEDRITVEKDYGKLVEKLGESDLPVFILPNYTSMLALRAKLGAATGKQEFWKG